MSSKLVDERVVQMSFDNKEFESNVKTSMNTIGNLKQSLDFSGVANSANKNLASIDASVLTDVLSGATQKFSALEVVAITAISNITNRLVNMGIQLAESLSVDNIAAGYQKLEEKTTSVATLASQDLKRTLEDGTSSAFLNEDGTKDYEAQMEYINTQLEKLNWYTDETSYSFTDMVSNISKFTAAGQNLDSSVNAMMGIANWAALSGQNASTASRAMYQLSQAMSSGTVKLADWKSIQNANMDTQEFRKKAIEAAEAAGTLTKNIDGTYSAVNGTSVTLENFASTLTEGEWFTADVLMKTLETYGGAVNKLYEAVESGDYNTSADAIKGMGDELDAFGVKAFKAAQEAKTWTDVVNATKDAVASTWMSTFEMIVGGYDEAKVLWTDLANEFWDIFASGGDFRNSWLSVWKDAGGREDIFGEAGAFWNLFNALKSVINIFKEAYATVFPKFASVNTELEGEVERVGNNFKELTEKIKNFTAKLIPAENTLTVLKNIIVGVLSTLKLGKKIISATFTALKPLTNLVTTIFNNIFNKAGDVSNTFSEWVNNTDIFNKAAIKVADVLTKVINKITPYVIKGIELIKTVFGYLKELPKQIKDSISKSQGGGLTAFLAKTFDIASEAILGIKTTFATTTEALKAMNELSDTATETETKLTPLQTFFKGIKDLLAGTWAIVKATIPVVSGLFSVIGDMMTYLASVITKTFGGESGLKNIYALIQSVLSIGLIVAIQKLKVAAVGIAESIKDIFDSVSGVLDAKKMEFYGNTMKSFAISILLIAAALILIASIDEDKLQKAIKTLATIMTMMVTVLLIMTKMFKKTKGSKGLLSGGGSVGILMAASGLIAFAVAVVILVTALKMLSKLSDSELKKGLISLTVIIGLMLGVCYLLTKMKKVIFKGTAALIPFAIAIRLLAKPISMLGKLKVTEILKGILALTLITALILIMTRLMKSFGGLKLMAFATGMLILSLAFNSIALAVKILGSMKIETLAKGIGAIGIIMAMITLISRLMKVKGTILLMLFAETMVILGVALTAMSGVVALLGSLNIKTLAKGLAAIGLLLLIVIAISKILSFGDSVKLIAFGVALSIMSLGLLAFSTALIILGKADLKTVGVGLLILVGSIILLAVASKALSSAIPEMLALAAALLLFAAAILVASAGITLIVAAIGMFGSALIGTLITIVDGIIALGPKLFEALQIVVEGVLNLLINNADLLFEVLGVYIDKILALLAEKGPDIIATILNLVVNLAEQLAVKLPELLQNLLNTIFGLLDTLIENVETLVDKLWTLIYNLTEALLAKVPDLLLLIGDSIIAFIDGLIAFMEQKLPEIITKTIDLIVAFIDALGESLVSNAGKIHDAIIRFALNLKEAALRLIFGDDLSDGIIEKIKELWEKLKTKVSELFEGAKEIGKNLINGIKDGIVEAWEKVKDTVTEIGDKVVGVFKKIFKIESPSKVMYKIGGYIDKGLVNGLNAYSNNVYNSAENVGDNLLNGINSAANQVAAAIDEGIEDELTIRPVLDLTEIQNGTQEMSQMLNKNNYTVGMTTSLAKATAKDISSKTVENNLASSSDIMSLKNSLEAAFAEKGEQINNTFNITGDNPKEIAEEVSRIMQQQIDRRKMKWA